MNWEYFGTGNPPKETRVSKNKGNELLLKVKTKNYYGTKEMMKLAKK